MITVDFRQGSHDLVEPLRRTGIEVYETETPDEMPFGDIAFEGRGEKGKRVQVGIEFKKIEELVGSLRTGRLQGHQAPGMQDAYDFRYLLIEGELLYDKRGRLLRRVGKRDFRPMGGGMGVGEFLKRLFVLHLRWGLNPLWARTRRDSLMLIEMLYRTWTDQDLDEHKSHLGIYQPPHIVPLSPFRQTVSSASFPGISIRKSLAVEKAFKGSLRRAVNAPTEEWAEIEVLDKKGAKKRLGTKIAAKITDQIK
jgi:ERCC4-type nuclease